MNHPHADSAKSRLLPGNGPKLSVLIHNRDSANIVGTCLKSVGAIDYRPLEVVVLDAQSTDGSQDVIADQLLAMQATGVETKFVSCPMMGCPASRNLASREASGDL